MPDGSPIARTLVSGVIAGLDPGRFGVDSQLLLPGVLR